ncbi:hypothetical protein WR25_11619 isoform B [Diploscapter pachys]|uniref:Uncharacterized protein n=1 Tax=Diploscapter pachys TaxID=2018661 RepID=A0A2A2KR54_9BILA|nr:hypothetical protein WR25_11619 isoform A [Diploscapter pachys]PAV76476.1 hypothetical protein WR25_11619 isoform B [Diploscapter pachys]
MFGLFINEITADDNVYEKAQERRGRSPLHFAASRASLDAVRTILESDKLGLPVDQKDKFGLTPLINRDGQTALHLAVAANNKPVVELFVKELGVQLEVFDNENRTPLHYGAEQGNEEIVQLLLDHGARNITRDSYGVTPAHYAAQFSVKCLDRILQKSNITEVKDNEHRSCLMWAVCAGNEEAIEYLIRISSPERTAMDIRGFTALHLSAMVGNENICKLLFKQGWSITAPDKSHNSPLHLAAGRGHTDVVRFLVTSGANMNERDAMERTPVFWACLGGQSHTLYCMIKEMSFEWRTMGEEHNPIWDALGRTLLHASAFAGSSACINVLLNIEEEDGCLSKPLVGYKDKEGDNLTILNYRFYHSIKF